MSETFEQIMKRAFVAIQGVKIPDMPEEIIALDKEMSSRYPNTTKMVDIISHNTILAAELLKIANSPAMRPNQPIKTITQAVSMMGTKNLKNLFISAALKHVFGNSSAIREIMDHSSDVGIVAAELANYVHDISPDEAYACALFHNCGAILLTLKDPEAYKKIFNESHSVPITSVQNEEKIFNSNHAAVGLLLSKKWQMNDEVSKAIYLHHTPDCEKINDEKVRILVGLLKTANAIVAEISLGAYIGQEMKDYMDDGVKTLLLKPEHLKEARLRLQTS